MNVVVGVYGGLCTWCFPGCPGLHVELAHLVDMVQLGLLPLLFCGFGISRKEPSIYKLIGTNGETAMGRYA